MVPSKWRRFKLRLSAPAPLLELEKRLGHRGAPSLCLHAHAPARYPNVVRSLARSQIYEELASGHGDLQIFIIDDPMHAPLSLGCSIGDSACSAETTRQRSCKTSCYSLDFSLALQSGEAIFPTWGL